MSLSRKKIRKGRGEHHEPNGETEFIGLNRQLEEEKRFEEILTNKLQEMEYICHKRELEILFLKKDLDKTVT